VERPLRRALGDRVDREPTNVEHEIGARIVACERQLGPAVEDVVLEVDGEIERDVADRDALGRRERVRIVLQRWRSRCERRSRARRRPARAGKQRRKGKRSPGQDSHLDEV